MTGPRDDDLRGPAATSGGEVVLQFANASKRALVQAGIPLFRDHGYLATPVNEIVRKAGVTKPTFYYHFRSKLVLLTTMLEASLEHIERALEDADTGTGTAVERLQRLVTAHVNEVADRPALFTIYYNERSRVDAEAPELAASLRARENRTVARYEQALVEGMESGELQAVDPYAAAMAFVGMASWMHRWYRKAGRLAPPEIAATFSMLAEGLRRDDRDRQDSARGDRGRARRDQRRKRSGVPADRRPRT